MRFFPFFAVLCLSGIGFAQTPEKLFARNCAGCHGTKPMGFAPLLFGQEPAYITKALTEFRSQTRQDRLGGDMNRRAQNLTDQQIKSLSSYLAGQDPCDIEMKIDPKADGFREAFLAGRTLAKEKNCAHCHDSYHHAAPRLYGQSFNYLKKSLQNLRSGKRTSASFPMMNRIASELTDDEIMKLSTYLNGMRLMRECNPSEN